MGLVSDCRAYFGTDDLYDVLLVGKTATEVELKKAYRRVSMIVHPDRVSESEKLEATKKFQTLAKVYFILSDNEKRAVYDETGEIDEENAIPEDRDWKDYWRLLFPRLTTKDIENFMNKYKGSDEEIENLRKCYTRFEGDMNKISEHFLGFDIDEEDRYRNILNGLIETNELPDFANFSKEPAAKRNARLRRFTREAAEASELKKALNIDNEQESLVKALAKRARERENQFDSMISNLEAKYGKKTRESTKKKK